MNGLGSICSKGGHVYPTGTAVGTAGSWFVKKKKKYILAITRQLVWQAVLISQSGKKENY